MASRPALWNRCLALMGLVCLVGTLLLLPFGVRTVRADGSDEALPAAKASEAPPPAAVVAPPPTAAPAGRATQPAPNARVGPPAAGGPDFVPLNTQGYNYRPEDARRGPR